MIGEGGRAYVINADGEQEIFEILHPRRLTERQKPSASSRVKACSESRIEETSQKQTRIDEAKANAKAAPLYCGHYDECCSK
jgi:hypothetical protein